MSTKAPVVTLPENIGKVTQARQDWEKLQAMDISKRNELRLGYMKELADSGDQDFTRVGPLDGQFIDLAIHKDTFLDDAAITRDIDVDQTPFYKSRYEPVVGVMTGSVYGGPMSSLYVTQDHYATLTPFVVDVQDVKVPRLALTQDVEKLGQREAALARQAEALKLAKETYLMNFIMNQPLGTDLAASVVNYVTTGNPYSGRTVYVADPGVQSGTYETTNIIDVHTEAGITPYVIDSLITQAFLQKRQLKTIHMPVQGLAWRKLMRYGTVVSNSLTGNAGEESNKNLESIPASKWEALWDANLIGGFVLDWFGHTIKFKANNALPQGYVVCTTDQPAAEIFNMRALSVSIDMPGDPRDQFFTSHYEKRQMAIAVPDPWLRNFIVGYIGNTSL